MHMPFTIANTLYRFGIAISLHEQFLLDLHQDIQQNWDIKDAHRLTIFNCELLTIKFLKIEYMHFKC